MDYKNQFVDENSYLVYGSEPDTAYDGSGGGGGGGGGSVEPLICLYDSNAGHIDKTVGDVYNAFTIGTPVILHLLQEGEDSRAGSWLLLDNIEFFGDDDNGYYVNVYFGGSMLYTDPANSIDEVMADYLHFGD